jgi:hypothetical protein
VSAPKPGDRVRVNDPALEQLADIFRKATGDEPVPNNVGVVDEVFKDTVVVIFDDSGQAAPYSLAEVEVL